MIYPEKGSSVICITVSTITILRCLMRYKWFLPRCSLSHSEPMTQRILSDHSLPFGELHWSNVQESHLWYRMSLTSVRFHHNIEMKFDDYHSGWRTRQAGRSPMLPLVQTCSISFSSEPLRWSSVLWHSAIERWNWSPRRSRRRYNPIGIIEILMNPLKTHKLRSPLRRDSQWNLAPPSRCSSVPS